jgi:hypothetical protein
MKKDWIKHLPPGKYFLKEILAMFKLSENSKRATKLRLIKYGAKVKTGVVSGTNISRDTYIWKGYKEPKATKPKEKGTKDQKIGA